MNEEELKRKILDILDKVRQKPKLQISFVECLFDFRQKQKDATYLAVIKWLYPDEYKETNGRGEQALLPSEETKKSSLQKLRIKIIQVLITHNY